MIDSGVVIGEQKGTPELYLAQSWGEQDTHEVMAISTNMRERGIQRPKQQNTDTTYFHGSKKLVRARRETFFFLVLSQNFCDKGSKKQNLNV